MKYQIIKPEVIYSSMMENSDMVRQFVEMYLFQSPLDFERLAETVAQNDIKSIEGAAHHIKPTMEYIGATALRSDFQELEDLARQQRDFTLISEKFDSITIKFNELLVELKRFLEEI